MIPQALQAALQHHQAGRLREAEAIYRQILQSEPDHPDALHLLGVIAHQVGQDKVAVDLIGKAIEANPAAAEFYNTLGSVLQAQGRLEEAVTRYQQAVTLQAEYAEAHYNLWNALCEALWMGVPVITLVGSSFLSRIGGSLLTHVGLTEAVTYSPAQYVERAVTLSKDLDHLSRLRLGLRARVAASLCDAETFVHNLEQAYQAMWRRWCESAT